LTKKVECESCEELDIEENMLPCVDCGSLFCQECWEMDRVPDKHQMEECDYEI